MTIGLGGSTPCGRRCAGSGSNHRRRAMPAPRLAFTQWPHWVSASRWRTPSRMHVNWECTGDSPSQRHHAPMGRETETGTRRRDQLTPSCSAGVSANGVWLPRPQRRVISHEEAKPEADRRLAHGSPPYLPFTRVCCCKAGWPHSHLPMYKTLLVGTGSHGVVCKPVQVSKYWCPVRRSLLSAIPLPFLHNPQQYECL